MTQPTAVMAYFFTRQQALDATQVFDVFFKVLPPHPAEPPLSGRPWEITVLVHEGVSEETLHVGLEFWDQMRTVVETYDGQVPPSTLSLSPTAARSAEALPMRFDLDSGLPSGNRRIATPRLREVETDRLVRTGGQGHAALFRVASLGLTGLLLGSAASNATAQPPPHDPGLPNIVIWTQEPAHTLGVPMPSGCTATFPTVSKTTVLIGGGVTVAASRIATSGITCTPASGFVVASEALEVQQVNFSGAWYGFAYISLKSTAAAAITEACTTFARKCVPGLYRRGAVVYSLTNLTTGGSRAVTQVSNVQAPLA